MDIRELGAADAEVYWALRLRALREHPEAFGTAYEEVRDRPIESTRQMLREHHEDAGRFILGAFDDAGTLVGMVRLGRETGLKDRHKAALTSMYVASEVQGQRVGKALMGEVMRRAQALAGLEQILLAVTAPNVEARGLYKAFGFTIYGTEPRALRLPDGTYLEEDLMILWLHEVPEQGLSTRRARRRPST
jgi:ribosomal protein S18 acetylase RimI-like enzyme